MLPIYAARYWGVKHPSLDKLMRTVERENYRTINGSAASRSGYNEIAKQFGDTNGAGCKTPR